MHDSIRRIIEWLIVCCVCFIIVAGGFRAGIKLSEDSWIDLDLPACSPVEVEKVINKGGMCDAVQFFKIGTHVEWNGKVLVVVSSTHVDWKSGTEYNIELKEVNY